MQSSTSRDVAALANLVLEQFEVHQTEAVAAVVADVLCPSFALDINKNVRLRLLELHSNNRWQVARGMPVGEVIGGEPLPWGVTDGTDVFFVGWVLSLAGYPDHLERETQR